MKRKQRARLGLICLTLVGSAVSRGIGDIVASGLGLSNTIAITTGWSTNSSASSRVPNTTAIATESSLAANASSTLVNTTSIPTGKFANASADSCWSSWTDYWAYSNAIANPKASPVTTIISEETGYVRGLPAETFTEVSTLTGTSTQFNGGFAISTVTLDSIATSFYTQRAREGSSYTRTDTYTSITLLSYDGPSVPVPTCQLSSTVPQCQSQWEAYASSELLPSPTPPSHCDINKGLIDTRPRIETQPPCASEYHASVSSWREQVSSVTKPPCTQASVGGQLCSTIKDMYVHLENPMFFPDVEFAPYFSNGYLGSFANITAQNYTKSWWWPTSSTLGVPGCTLGCGRCAVTGNTVQLLYWPEATQSGPVVDQSGPITVSTLGTVLTSPTYYISYQSVFASDGCSGVGPTIYNTIVPVPGTEQLSSVFGGTLPCNDAHVQNGYTQEWTATAPFNVTDLNEPVPFSIYSSQPWCATYQYEHGCNKDCPTTDAYKPLIVVPEVVLQNMNPAWASCYGDIRGVYDPPIALTQVASVKVPQMTVSVPATSEATHATPASSPSHPAAKTGGPKALPDNLPSNSVGGNAAQVPQPTKPSQSLGGVGAGTVRPNDFPASNAADGTAPHASQSSGSSQDVGDMVAAILGGSASSNGDESSSDHLFEAGVPKEHPNAFSSSNVVGIILPHGSQASGSVQDVGGLVAAILDGAENSVEANPASAGQGLPGNSPSGSTAGDSEPQASWSFALFQNIGDTVASILRDGGRLPGTGASVSRPPQGVAESEWDSLHISTFNPESGPHEASDLIMESQKGDQTPTAQPSGANAFVTSQSSPTLSYAHNSDTLTSLPSDASVTKTDNKSGVSKPTTTRGSNADIRASADSSKSIAASVSKAAVLSSGNKWMICSKVFMVIVSSCAVLQFF